MEMKKRTPIPDALRVVALLIIGSLFLTSKLGSSHIDHGGVIVGDYQINIEPPSVQVGKEANIYVLIDYAANHTGVSGLKVSVKIVDGADAVLGSYEAKELGKGVYYLTTRFSQTGTYMLVVRVGNATATLPLDVIEQDRFQSSVLSIAPFAAAMAAVIAIALFVRKRVGLNRHPRMTN